MEDIWFPHHVLQPSTRESYRYVLNKHLLLREWVSERVSAGISPATIRHSKIVLSAIFTTALNDQVTLLHPGKGVKTPTDPVKSFRIITPEQCSVLHRGPRAPQTTRVDPERASPLGWCGSGP